MTDESIDKIKQTIKHVGDNELALGWLRYEAVRKLNVVEFANLIDRNLKGERFDDMVDELIPII